NHGGVGLAVPATILVTSPVPIVTISGTPSSVFTGATVSLTSTVTEAGGNQSFSYAWQALVGSTVEATGTSAGFTFTPTIAGQTIVSLVVTDTTSGTTGTNSVAFTVNDVAPTAIIGGAPSSSPEGTIISLVSADPNQNAVGPLSYAWSATKNSAPFASA